MEEKKQIEEMAEFLWRNTLIHTEDLCHDVAETLVTACYRKQSAWISVEERLPDADKNVLVITAHGSFKVARCNIYKNGTEVIWATNDGLGERAITHWMPLPEPPKMKGGVSDA